MSTRDAAQNGSCAWRCPRDDMYAEVASLLAEAGIQVRPTARSYRPAGLELTSDD